MRGKKSGVALVTLALIFLFQGAAIAGQSTPYGGTEATFGAERLAYRQDVNIPEGQEVENLILIGGNAVVAGSVRDEVIVIYGNLVLKPTARVGDRVAVVGGGLSQDPGAMVGKGIYRLDLGTTTLNGLFLGAMAFLGLEALRLAGFVALILAATLINLPLVRVAERAAGLAAVKLRKGVLLGLVGSLGLGAAVSLFVLTIVGIPFALLLILAGLAMAIFGLSVLSRSLGQAVVDRLGWFPWPGWASAALGSALLALLASAPLFGLLLLIALQAIGLGITLLYLTERNKA